MQVKEDIKMAVAGEQCPCQAFPLRGAPFSGGAGRVPPPYRGVPRSQETASPNDPTLALCLGTYGDPRGVGVSYERGTPIHLHGVACCSTPLCTGVPRTKETAPP